MSDLEDRITALEKIHEKFRVVGGANVSVSGSLRQGYAVCSTCPGEESTNGIPVTTTTPTGACCVGTDCTIETEEDCVDMEGEYQGDDTECDPNPCETGCCPWTDPYTTISLSGSITGCPGGDILITERTWIKHLVAPSDLNTSEFTVWVLGGQCSFYAAICNPGSFGYFQFLIADDADGCTPNNYLMVDFVGADCSPPQCGPLVALSGVANGCDSVSTSCSYDLSGGSLSVDLPGDLLVATFHFDVTLT